jgi:hypothetical protein
LSRRGREEKIKRHSEKGVNKNDRKKSKEGERVWQRGKGQALYHDRGNDGLINPSRDEHKDAPP